MLDLHHSMRNNIDLQVFANTFDESGNLISEIDIFDIRPLLTPDLCEETLNEGINFQNL